MTIWCRYKTERGPRFGILMDEQIVEIAGDPFGEHHETGVRVNYSSTRLLPPVVPPVFYAVGLNYRGHILVGEKKGVAIAKFPSRPDVGYRANNALIGHEDEIVKPRDYPGPLEYEGEVVVVLGRRLKKCSRDEAAAAIFGWTIGNDVSAREWQFNDRTFWRGKNSDTFKPMGPHIVTDFDVAKAQSITRVNGKVSSTFAVGDMIFDHIDYITEMAKYITLIPGDIIWMGADGTGPIVPGDTVEVEVTGLGTLRNRVVHEAGDL